MIYADKLFKSPVAVIKAFNNAEFVAAFEQIERWRKTHYLLGYVRYEAKDVFWGMPVNLRLPLLYFEVFAGFEEYIPGGCGPRFELEPEPALGFEQYYAAFRRVKEEIACGNTYEVNFTFDFDIAFEGDSFELYEYLLSKQRTPYNCFIKNEYETLLSFSPELFFELRDGHIVTKPMKGTVKRGATAQEDARLVDFLKNDVKNRAENVMIVDLLRNDLGRIAKAGTVNVTKLFEVETHPTLHQMTSQIEADLPGSTTLWDVFKAVFPCGSITGAPKISTMRLIDEIETGARGIYCGAVGFFSPEKTVFSVPIRILQLRDGACQYRAGGAVVWDSNVQDEWMEALAKTRFLNSDFKLIETFNTADFERHLARMEKTAQHYGFPFSYDKIKLPAGVVRLLLDKAGNFEIERKELRECKSDGVRISPLRVNSGDDFLYHKTTCRPYYRVDYERFYDEIFFNERGELTEGSRSNVILELSDGKLYTPPVKCGLLNGIGRQKLLETGKCKEKILYEEDLCAAAAIYCVNSLRGLKKVALV